MKNKIALFCVFAFFSSGNLLFAEQREYLATKENLLERIKICADYACDVLLDEEGKSRCDYDIFESRWTPYETSWHTGQLINALLEAYQITENRRYLEKAILGGNWWISLAIRDNSVMNNMIKGIHGDHMDNNLIVFATISDGTPGIYNLSKVTGNPVYAETATRAAHWMLDNMYDDAKGVCYDNVDVNTGKVIKSKSDFTGKLYYFYRPNTEGCLFKDAYEFSGNKEFRKAFLTLCDSLVHFQTPEGLWMQFKPNEADHKTFHPRFNLWYAESLLEAYDMTNNKLYLESAARVARFYTKYQQKDGAMFYHADLDGNVDKSSICSSEVAFAGLLWMRLFRYGYPEFEKFFEKSVSWLMNSSYSSGHSDPNLRGAVVEITTRISKGKTKIINRDIGTSFALRFLTSYYHLRFTF